MQLETINHFNMKKYFLATLFIISSLSALSQTSSGVWNSKTATYTNSEHHISWKLIEEADWVGRPILVESTLFKVRNDDSHILITLSADKIPGLEGDIWDHISAFNSPEIEDNYKNLAKQNGMNYMGLKAEKSELSGFHAIRTIMFMEKYHPENQQTVNSIEVKYTFYKGDYMYNVTVSALSLLEEDIDLYDTIFSVLFDGFKIN